MRIVVCLKLIADPDIVEFNITTEELDNIHPVLDPIDNYVLEEGLALRERLGGEVIAVSVTHEAGDEILRNALLCGADRAIRLWHNELQSADTWLVTQVIKEGLDKIGFDLILCGSRSQDIGSNFMVSALAHRLNIASATGIIDLEPGSGNGNGIIAHKKLPKGERETYSLKLPAVLGIEEGINEPRYVAPFSKIYREGISKKIEFLEASLSSLKGNQLIKNLRFTQPRPRVKVGINVSTLSMQEKLKMMRGELGREKKELFEGSPEEAARKILTQLREALK
jgi:electron transfer flavoprotein beta subunit